MHQLKGLSYENKARRFLNRQGLIFIDRNYHCRMGEIDLIMEDADTIVFIEVRYRKSELFGGAMASVTPKKQQRVIKAAQHYLNEKKKLASQCTFRRYRLLSEFDGLAAQRIYYLGH
jgi:putative endonuclease